MFAQFYQEVEVEDVEDIALAFSIFELPQKRLKQKLNRNSRVFREHDGEVVEDYFSDVSLVVVFDEKKDQLLVEKSCHFTLVIGQVMQKIEQP